MSVIISTNISRHDFLKVGGAFAFAPFVGALAASDEKPLFRMGVMTDTHIGPSLESCSLVKAALELFKAKGVDIVVNNGDIAERFYPSGYGALRKLYDSVFSNVDERPREVWVYAWHDAIDFKKPRPPNVAKYAAEAFEEVRRLLGAKDPVTASFIYRGIPMLVFHQFESTQIIERMVADAAAANPGKPIFVFTHVPPAGTVYNSWNWGEMRQRRIYEKYPQVVAFTGHIHGSLHGDFNIWQKDFTVINSGCLHMWGGISVNDDAMKIKPSYGVLIVDVYRSRILVRRFDVRDGSEIEPDGTWNVALPFSPSNARYTIERKRRCASVPEYPKGARLSAVSDANGTVSLVFPEVHGATRAFLHRAEIERKDAKGRWIRYAVRESYGDFHLSRPEQTRKIVFQSGYFTPGEKVRFTVRPLNAYGIAGKALVARHVVPVRERVGKVVFDVKGTPVGSVFLQCHKNVRCSPDRNGFYAPMTDVWTESFLIFPKGAFAGPTNTRFRLICDMEICQNAEGAMWELSLKDAATGVPLTRGMHTAPGSPGVLRYVFEFSQPSNASGDCRLSFSRGAGSRVRFDRVRLDICE